MCGKIFLFYFHGKKGLPGAFQTLGAVIPKSLGFVLTPLQFGSLENIGKHAWKKREKLAREDGKVEGLIRKFKKENKQER